MLPESTYDRKSKPLTGTDSVDNAPSNFYIFAPLGPGSTWLAASKAVDRIRWEVGGRTERGSAPGI